MPDQRVKEGQLWRLDVVHGACKNITYLVLKRGYRGITVLFRGNIEWWPFALCKNDEMVQDVS